MMPRPPIRGTTIAIVDDDESVRTALKSLLRSSGYEVRTYSSAIEFLETNGPVETHCLICDVQMPGMSGVELHERLGALGMHIPTLLISAYPGKIAHLATDARLITCLPKPCEADKLLSCVEAALSQRT